jgi:hypothetical protein
MPLTRARAAAHAQGVPAAPIRAFPVARRTKVARSQARRLAHEQRRGAQRGEIGRADLQEGQTEGLEETSYSEIPATAPKERERKERGPRVGVKIRRGRSTHVKKERNWRKEDMEKAVLEIYGGKPQRTAAKDNHVPYTTLRRRVKGLGEKKRAPTVLPRYVEEKIVEYIIEMAEKGLSTSRAAVGLRVKVIVEIAKCEHPFTNGIPGKRWWELFLKRWPGITARKGQTLDKGRAMALNAATIQSFFVNLRRVVREKGLTDADIYNCDETSFVAGVVQTGVSKCYTKGVQRKRTGGGPAFERT